ncbi:hypothetical protein ACF0H5_009137 [Mactra antiquata]
MATGGLPDLSTVVENLESQNDEILALQAIFQDDVDRLEVLDTATQDESGEILNLNTLKMYVPVICHDILHADCYIPVNEDDNVNQAEGINNGLQLARSDSGQRMVFSFEVNHLPPLCLQVTLPQTYPLYDPPVFVLSCIWLSTSQLTVICQHLDKLWEESKGGEAEPGMPVLYTWLDWLQENTLSTLGITSHLTVSSYQVDDDVDDCRVIVNNDLDFNAIVTYMMRYNQRLLQQEFKQSEQECSICFDVNLGSKFFILPECNHHVCRECLTSHCQLLVKEGTVLHIRCPMYECKCNIPPYVLREILTSEEFERFESLSLQKGLEVMGDVTWCPRCNNVVIMEPDKHLNLAQCLTCFFTFCTLCMDTWHQGKKCEDEEKLDAEEKEKAENDRTRTIEEEKRRIEQKIQNKESKRYITQMAKRCPECNAPIMKIGGYGKLIQRRLKDDPDLRRLTISCPTCKQLSLKEDPCNLMRCWNCKSSICFSCKQVLRGSVGRHYTGLNVCQQHTPL